MVSYLADMMKRLTEVEKEALADIGVTADAYPYFGIKAPSSMPSWVNRLAGTTVTANGNFILTETVSIQARLMIAHATQDYDGNIFDLAYEWIPPIETWLLAHDMLQSTLYPTFPNYLTDGLTYVGNSGLTFFTYSGIQTSQLGIEFNIDLPINRYIE